MGQSGGQALAGRSELCLCHILQKASLPTGALVVFLTQSVARPRCVTWLSNLPYFQHLALPGPVTKQKEYLSPDGFPHGDFTGHLL